MADNVQSLELFLQFFMCSIHHPNKNYQLHKNNQLYEQKLEYDIKSHKIIDGRMLPTGHQIMDPYTNIEKSFVYYVKEIKIENLGREHKTIKKSKMDVSELKNTEEK